MEASTDSPNVDAAVDDSSHSANPLLTDDSSSDTDGALSHLSQESAPRRRGILTFVDSLALVISLQIGSGILAAPSQVAQHVSSSTIGISTWLIGGLLVWTGAASFIELGLAVPGNGGVQEYLRASYGDFVAFLFSWTWCIVAKPCAMAMISIIFANQILGIISTTLTASMVWTKIIALTVLGVLAFVNCIGTKTGAKLANVFLVVKIFIVYSIAFLGLAWALYDGNPSTTKAGDDQPNEALFEQQTTADYVTALFGVLFCYGGWETIGFVAGDMQDPVRHLPWVLNVAMAIAIVGFVLLNYALYLILGISRLQNTTTPIVDTAAQIFGNSGKVIYSLLAAACAAGALNSNLFSTARLISAAAERGYFPPVLSNMHTDSVHDEEEYFRTKLHGLPSVILSAALNMTWRTSQLRFEKQVPIFAVILEVALTSFFIIVGTFNALVTFYGIVEYIFFLIAVLGIHRIRQLPSNHSSYRAWAGNPAIFCAVSALIILRGVITSPAQGLAILLFLIMGWAGFRLRFRPTT